MKHKAICYECDEYVWLDIEYDISFPTKGDHPSFVYPDVDITHIEGKCEKCHKQPEMDEQEIMDEIIQFEKDMQKYEKEMYGGMQEDH